MRQHMPGTVGEVDCGSDRVGWEGPTAGPVRVTRSDGSIEIRAAYSGARVEAIVKQGRERPRPLTASEEALRDRNREQSAGDGRAMEAWYRAECRDSDLRGRALWMERHPGPSEHLGRYMQVERWTN